MKKGKHPTISYMQKPIAGCGAGKAGLPSPLLDYDVIKYVFIFILLVFVGEMLVYFPKQISP